MITKLAIVGRDNEPLYLETFGVTDPDAIARSNIKIHSALDFLEEKLTALRQFNSMNADLFLGTLLSIEDTRIYGYCSNSRVKFLVLAREGAADSTVKMFMRSLHGLYLNAISNPFHERNTPLDQPNFVTAVRQLVTTFNKQAVTTPVVPSTTAAAGATAPAPRPGQPPLPPTVPPAAAAGAGAGVRAGAPVRSPSFVTPPIGSPAK